MDRSIRRIIAGLVLCAVGLMDVRPARASINSDVAWAFTGIALAGAAIGVGIYFIVRRPPSVTGCASNGGAGGMQIRDESDGKAMPLLGDLSGVRAGERIRVTGKRHKNAAGERTFLVEKVKVYGPCPVTP